MPALLSLIEHYVYHCSVVPLSPSDDVSQNGKSGTGEIPLYSF
jgi:hypothetical protein